MHFPWSKALEHRASYSNAAVDALLSGATQAPAEASATAAAAAGIRAISDPFAVANVTPIALASVLNSSFLVDMARRVLLTGNAVYMLDVDENGALDLVSTSSWEISGGYKPSTWVYRVDLARPSGEPVTRMIPAEGVVHVRVGAKSISPWAGVSPLRECGLTSDALASLDRSLGLDASPPAGLLMALPDGATQAQMDMTGVALGSGRGAISVMQTTAQGFGAGKQAAPSGPASDYRQIRYGPELQQANIYAHDQLTSSVLNALGVSERRFSGEGPGQREGYRLTMLGPVQALAAVIEAELSSALGQTVELDFEKTRALDSGQRARGVQALVNAGSTLADALDIMGLLQD